MVCLPQPSPCPKKGDLHNSFWSSPDGRIPLKSKHTHTETPKLCSNWSTWNSANTMGSAEVSEQSLSCFACPRRMNTPPFSEIRKSFPATCLSPFSPCLPKNVHFSTLTQANVEATKDLPCCTHQCGCEGGLWGGNFWNRFSCTQGSCKHNSSV